MLVADVLPGNLAMIAVFGRSVYPVEVRSDAHGVNGAGSFASVPTAK